MQKVNCRSVLAADGWRSDQSITIDESGRIAAIDPVANTVAMDVDILIPAPANLHSHAFQRAMAGMAERRGPGGQDSFWTWRELMYRFLDAITPDDVEAIASFVQMESLEAGFGSLVEFHYLHHQPRGRPYDNLAEMGERIVTAASLTGCGLTLLPVLYHQGGCDGRALGPGQTRFGCNVDLYQRLVESSRTALATLPDDARLGLAPHSLRAVSPDSFRQMEQIVSNSPIHVHIAEQTAEVDEVWAIYGARPVEWLLANATVDPRWCLIHATQMEPNETLGLAKTGAVAGLCPITEANLGDGIFDGVHFLKAKGRFGVGSDSNIHIDLVGELRQLDYSQRLRDHSRAALASEARSTGRRLLEDAAKGSAQAAARGPGVIEVGAMADLTALDGDAIDLIGKERDTLLDSWIFAGSEPAIRHVWSAGRHVVRDGRHIARETVRQRYAKTIQSFKGRI
ncbi:MAG: formimidoylglutamate deiminase [Pseudomonadota bacterium]